MFRAFLVAGALALRLLAAAPLQDAKPPANTAGPGGTWRGHIDVPPAPLEVVVTFTAGAGELRGKITIPAQNAKDLPLDVTRDGDALTFAIQGVPGEPTFTGKLAQDGLRGTFTQAGQEFSFTLARATAKRAFADFGDAVDKARAALDVPGLAVAVVADGEVVFAQGFGVRDIDRKEPVTPRSLFAIGSTTKAMTAFVLATLLAEGKATWDTPVREAVPEFRLADPMASHLCTLRDLACHRSGLPRHDLVWYLAAMPRDELLRRLPHLPLAKSPRTQFQYCNHGYAVLGEAVARLSGATWEEAMRARLFRPLGMPRTRTDAGAFAKDDEIATGHSERQDALRTVARRQIAGMAPAGAVESCVEDLVRWAALQLGKGSVDGKRICDGALLEAQAVPLIPVGSPRPDTPEIVPIGYGLGWFVDLYRGRRHVQHGGGIDGFTAHVAFFPDDGFGIVALANRDNTPLPALIDRLAADRLLGAEGKDWAGEAAKKRAAGKKAAAEANAKKADAKPAEKCAHPLAAYAGEYVDPGYGTLQVSVVNEGLAVRLASADVPLAHVHRETFALSADGALAEIDGTKVLFVTGFDGDVEALRIRLEPSVPAITFTRRADPGLLDPAVLARYTGRYKAKDDTVVTVSRDGAGLSLTVPGQPVYKLAPVSPGLFQIGDLDGYRARFSGDDAASAHAVAFEQPNGTFRFERVE